MKKRSEARLLLAGFCAILALSVGNGAVAADCNGPEGMFYEGIPYDCNSVKVTRRYVHEAECMDTMYSEGMDYNCQQWQAAPSHAKTAMSMFGDMNSEGITFEEITRKSK